MFRIEVITTTAQLKTFFKLTNQDEYQVEDLLLKKIIKKNGVSAGHRLWLALDENSGECKGRIAVHLEQSGVGHISCFSLVEDMKGIGRQLIERATRYLQEQNASKILGPQLPWPYLEKGIIEGDPSIDDFFRLGFLPHYNVALSQEKLSIVLSSKTKSICNSNTINSLKWESWRMSNWEAQIAIASNLLNRNAVLSNYVTEEAFEESLLAHGGPDSILALTAYQGFDPIAFVVAKICRKSVPRYKRFPGFFSKSIICSLEMVFLEMLPVAGTSFANELERSIWMKIGEEVLRVNGDDYDPLVTYPTLRSDQTINKIVFSKILRPNAA